MNLGIYGSPSVAPTTADLEAEAERVAERIRARGEWVSADLRVSVETAAYELDGMKPSSLLNRKYTTNQPPQVIVGRAPTYFIVDILRLRKAA